MYIPVGVHEVAKNASTKTQVGKLEYKTAVCVKIKKNMACNTTVKSWKYLQTSWNEKI